MDTKEALRRLIAELTFDGARAIQLALTPVFLLTGIAGLLNVMTGRLSRIIDRGRFLTESPEGRITRPPQERDEELRSLEQHPPPTAGGALPQQFGQIRQGDVGPVRARHDRVQMGRLLVERQRVAHGAIPRSP